MRFLMLPASGLGHLMAVSSSTNLSINEDEAIVSLPEGGSQVLYPDNTVRETQHIIQLAVRQNLLRLRHL